MSFHNNDSVQAEVEPPSAADEDETNFMEMIESMTLLDSNGISGNGVCAKVLDSKNGFSNNSSQENVVKQSLKGAVTNTSTDLRLYRNDSTEFTSWPKRRIKLQGGRLVNDKDESEAMDITTECCINDEIPDAVPDSAQSLESQPKYATEKMIKMECISSGRLGNLAEEFRSSRGSLFGNNATASTSIELPTNTQMLISNTEISAGIRKHILDLPDLVLEHILSYIDLSDLSEKVRPVCRTFYILSSRILRLAFKSIHIRICSTLQKLEDQHPSNWNPICAEVLTCKLLQSEMDTLRAACSRQIESGHFCFIPGDVLQEYNNIIHAVQDGKINVMLDGFSDKLIKLNEKPLKYWDTRYDDEDMLLGEMKLLGVEIIEILLSALNAAGCIVVTYQPSFNSASSSNGEDAGGSCMMAGCVSINWSTELKPPPIDHISVKAQRRAILRYIRSLVRANNCDIVLYKLRAYSKEKETSLPIFEHRTWTLCNSKVVHHDMIQESYKKEPVSNHSSTPVPDCNMNLICSFEMICPKRVNPFGIKLDRQHHSPLSPEVIISEEKDTHASNLAESLSGDCYTFKMDFKTWTPGSSHEHSIEIENYVTKTNKWFLNINTNSSLVD